MLTSWQACDRGRTPLRTQALACAVAFVVIAQGGRSAEASEQTAPTEAPRTQSAQAADFARDVRPIFEKSCIACHGPSKQKAGLRLDERESALHSPRTVDVPLVVAGDSAKSLLYQRVTSADPDERMPAKGEPLTVDQVAIIRAWIDQGADWPAEKHERKVVDHWAFKAPVRPALPDVERGDWARNPIDRFILARLEAERLSPSPEADRRALIRRLSFDLTGLPPTLAEVDSFVNDEGKDAYDKAVDRLLASPAYGERMAVDWLDLARYADTNGYHIDNHRDMWKWRDWVIESFNRNARYDQFTIEQLAGDLLPNATLEQRVATGFNRNGPINFEGGADPDEYQTKYVIDRVNTTATVWMGLTMACAECHDHKYDPIAQREFYSFYAFFNNIAEKGLDGEKQNPIPSVKLPSAEQARLLAEKDAAIAEKERALADPDPTFDSEQASWESVTAAHLPPLPVWEAVDAESLTSTGGTTLVKLADGSVLAGGINPASDVYEITAPAGTRRISAFKLEALVDASLPHAGAGRANNANFVLSGFEAEIVSSPAESSGSHTESGRSHGEPSGPHGEASGPHAVSSGSLAVSSGRHAVSSGSHAETSDSHAQSSGSLAVSTGSHADAPCPQQIHFASASADYEQTEGGFLVAKAIDGDSASGWAVAGYDKRVNREAIFVPDAPLDLQPTQRLRVRLRFESPYRKHGIGRFRISTTGDLQFDRGSTSIAMGHWWSVGPFNTSGGGEAFHTAFPPEEEFAQPIDTSKTYLGGALAWREHPDWSDGQSHTLTGETSATYLYRTFTSDEAQPLLLLIGSDDAVQAWFNGERVLSNDVQRALEVDQERVRVDVKAGLNRLLVKIVNYGGNYAFSFSNTTRLEAELPRAVALALRLEPTQRTDADKKELREHFRRKVSERGKALIAESEALKKTRVEIDAKVPQSMIMEERPERRATNVLVRGNFQRKGELVSPDVPAFLPPLPVGSERNRLALARWLVSPEHPLTARVTVNHYWQMLMGTGLVKTSEDFGARGERPSHPELLDWLAVEFVESGWDLKALLRSIVTSAAYRQSARVTPQLLEVDPENRLLARGPRQRLSAEMIRDNALAVSGLLVPKIGGPSVRPYQPEGLWEAVSFSKDFSSQFYAQDHADDLYRRGLYVYWKRALPYPSLATFDAPIRETCTARRPVTETPLQALILLNDPTFVEAARQLGLRMLQGGGGDVDARLVYGFRLCTSRVPTPREMDVLRRAQAAQAVAYAKDRAAAEKLVAIGESKNPAGIDASEIATWTAVGSLLLNLDETVHRGS